MKKEPKENSGIVIIIGTKAELIKCVPIMLELQRIGIEYVFVHTGQHPLGEACEDFGIKKPDFILSPEPEISTKFWSKIDRISFVWFFMMITKIKRLLRTLKPRYVVYHGDTMSTATASIGSSSLLNPGKKKKWKNVHLEAGLRSGSLLEPFPEEISRQICDKFSDILLAVSDLTEENLKKDRKKLIRSDIRKRGNTIVDSAIISYNKSKKNRKQYKKKEKYALINLHRHENLKSRKRMKRVVEILKSIGIRAIWPLHDNTKFYLEKYGLIKDIEKMENIEITPLEDYFRFISLLAECEYLVTDGGSIQEESLVFKKPCILLRKRTERQEGLGTGINFLTGLNVKKTRELIKDIEKGRIKARDFENPYGEVGLSERIVKEDLK